MLFNRFGNCLLGADNTSSTPFDANIFSSSLDDILGSIKIWPLIISSVSGSLCKKSFAADCSRLPPVTRLILPPFCSKVFCSYFCSNKSFFLLSNLSLVLLTIPRLNFPGNINLLMSSVKKLGWLFILSCLLGSTTITAFPLSFSM